ncbi:DUF2156 domain-containing protein, partial [bacterium]|nr:DUF2156 domain-containing protein [bacterium]
MPGWLSDCVLLPSEIQAFWPGITLWKSRRFRAVIGYVRVGKSGAVVVTQPLGNRSDWGAVVREFEAEFSRVTWFGCSGDFAGFLRSGKRRWVTPIGIERMDNPREWVLLLRRNRNLMKQLQRAANHGVIVSEVNPVEYSDELVPMFRQWIGRKTHPFRLGFIATADVSDRIKSGRIWVARCDGDIVAYALVCPDLSGATWLIEQWVRLPNAPNGSIESVISAAIQGIGADGATCVSMGLSPLDGLDRSVIQNAVGGFVRWAIKWVYSADGLNSFKSKFGFRTAAPRYVVV